jgi:hypothetical protein
LLAPSKVYQGAMLVHEQAECPAIPINHQARRGHSKVRNCWPRRTISG